MLITTTGGGSHRFNPNLYKNGKVCLSLLGTWQGEPWNPKLSTLHQVFVSIYGLIFVESPYFNEPGYQSTIGTPEGTAANNQYNASQRFKTVELAMVDSMRKPSPEFAVAISRHFALRQAPIRDMVRRWSEENRKQGGAHKDLSPQVSALERELAKLPPLS